MSKITFGFTRYWIKMKQNENNCYCCYLDQLAEKKSHCVLWVTNVRSASSPSEGRVSAAHASHWPAQFNCPACQLD